MRTHTIITAFALAACGGGTTGPTGPVDPKLVSGGGVADAPVDGVLHIYVVEPASATPIVGANVRVEAATPLTGVTDTTGLVSFTDPMLAGLHTITATATGHAATTWIGVAGANVTLPLDPASKTPPMAQVSGTITGWNNIPAPSGFNHYTLGVVLYSFLDDPSAPENVITQPMSGGTPTDTCLRTAVANNCAWQMNARIGKQIHTAVIVDGDTKGTNSDLSDDTYTLIGYAAGNVMTLTAGQQVTNEALTMVSATTPLAVALPPAPSGLPHIAAIPELALGDAGRIVFPLPPLAASGSVTVLAPTGNLAGHYELVALATPSAAAKAPFTSAFAHNVSGTATIGSWLAAPAQVTAGSTFSFSPSTGATFYTAQLTKGTTTLWNITVLDGTTSFSLPALSPDPIGSGSITFAVTAADVPSFDAAKFDVPTIKQTLARAAGAQAVFTH
ncbi:MAG: hypothetical protein JWO36_6560 [Myxococcales bacterium]|nr:hypothetical protein [Myxococcales bacterium]